MTALALGAAATTGCGGILEVEGGVDQRLVGTYEATCALGAQTTLDFPQYLLSQPGVTPGIATSFRLGDQVELFDATNAAAVCEKTVAASGAPATALTGLPDTGVVVFADVEGGRVLAPNDPAFGGSIVASASPSSGELYGSVLAAVDLVGEIAHPSNPGWSRYGGKELLVGVPNDVNTVGYVDWFYADVDPACDTVQWNYGGTVMAPLHPSGAGGGPAIGGNFGAAIAAPDAAPGTSPPFLAIGAPGAAVNSVHLFEIDPGNATTPLALLGSVPAPTSLAAVEGELAQSGSGNTAPLAGFGRAIHFEQLDDDGLVDLVVGAPALAADTGAFTNGLGSVAVFYGSGASPVPFDVASPVGFIADFSSPGVGGAGGPTTSNGADEFGFAFASQPGTLVIGAPGYTNPTIGTAEAGAICQVVFPAAVRPSLNRDDWDCSPSPFVDGTNGSANQRFGHALAIADVITKDSHAYGGNPIADRAELLVGSPGGDEREWSVGPDGTWGWGNPGAKPGSVAVFVDDDAEAAPGRRFRTDLTHLDSAFGSCQKKPWCTPVFALYGSSPGDEFGAALSVHTLAGESAPDLLIGAPGVQEPGGARVPGVVLGDLHLTANRPVKGHGDGTGPSPYSGLYTMEDSNNVSHTARIVFQNEWSNLRFLFNDTFPDPTLPPTQPLTFRLVDTSGATCVLNGTPLEVTDLLSLPDLVFDASCPGPSPTYTPPGTWVEVSDTGGSTYRLKFEIVCTKPTGGFGTAGADFEIEITDVQERVSGVWTPTPASSCRLDRGPSGLGFVIDGTAWRELPSCVQ